MKNTSRAQSTKTAPQKGLFDFSDPDSGLGGSRPGHTTNACSVIIATALPPDVTNHPRTPYAGLRASVTELENGGGED
ncbi:hypothetical protein E0Z10_g9989 [Xylaria hypoxylon]|uniref:Uncharacterized protein n=1 Tax=Xylaria hypoxylon TaxID=37992 RepID=A0A4Z0YM95_9PEZI|nr:hypothetical protein E0Z10_g9989 [Xylaria hypoxylon]